MTLKNSTRKNAKAFLALSVLAGLTMGNEGCEQAKDRVLKMDVEIGNVAARTITMPSGEKIDFNYLSNALFYQAVQTDGHFVMMGPIPTVTSTVASLKAKSLSSKVATAKKLSTDERVLEKFGFMEQLEEKAKAQLSGSNQSSLVAPSVSASAVAANEVPLCVYDLPHAKLAGEVVSFEANWGVGVGIGYGTDGVSIPTGGVAGSVKFKSSRLQMGLRLQHMLSGEVLGAAAGVSTQKDVKFGLNLASALLGLDLFYKTPLASVVTSGMSKALTGVVTDMIKQKSQIGKWDDVWESRVIYDPKIADNDTYVAIRGGYRYSMRVGDTFTVQNMHYKWSDDSKPCESKLKYEIGGNKLAELEVVELGDNVAVARVTKWLVEENILAGAKIKLLKMYVTPEEAKAKAALAKAQAKK